MNKKNIKNIDILVVAGGWSNEREVSLLSGKNAVSYTHLTLPTILLV